MSQNCHNRGSTLIEIIVVVFIVTTAMVALANLTWVSLARNRTAKEITVATRLAQEGIEWFKAQRTELGYVAFALGVLKDTNICLLSPYSSLTYLSTRAAPADNVDCDVEGQAGYRRWFSIAEGVENGANYVSVTSYVIRTGRTAAEAISVTGKIYQWQR